MDPLLATTARCLIVSVIFKLVLDWTCKIPAARILRSENLLSFIWLVPLAFVMAAIIVKVTS